jgi:hypothetical protein
MGFHIVDSYWVETDEPDRQRALERVDALAWRLVGRAAPARLGPVVSPAEEAAVRTLERDRSVAVAPADDDRTLYVAAWEGEELVAACRFVLPADDRYLPIEEAFDLILEPRGLMADIGVVAIAPAREAERRRIVPGLLGWAWLESRLLDFTDLCCTLTPYEVSLCERHGLEVVVLGESRPVGGEERFPAIVRPLETILIPYSEVGGWGMGDGG